MDMEGVLLGCIQKSTINTFLGPFYFKIAKIGPNDSKTHLISQSAPPIKPESTRQDSSKKKKRSSTEKGSEGLQKASTSNVEAPQSTPKASKADMSPAKSSKSSAPKRARKPVVVEESEEEEEEEVEEVEEEEEEEVEEEEGPVNPTPAGLKYGRGDGECGVGNTEHHAFWGRILPNPGPIFLLYRRNWFNFSKSLSLSLSLFLSLSLSPSLPLPLSLSPPLSLSLTPSPQSSRRRCGSSQGGPSTDPSSATTNTSGIHQPSSGAIRLFRLPFCVPQAVGFWRAPVQIRNLKKAM